MGGGGVEGRTPQRREGREDSERPSAHRGAFGREPVALWDAHARNMPAGLPRSARGAGAQRTQAWETASVGGGGEVCTEAKAAPLRWASEWVPGGQRQGPVSFSCVVVGGGGRRAWSITGAVAGATASVRAAPLKGIDSYPYHSIVILMVFSKWNFRRSDLSPDQGTSNDFSTSDFSTPKSITGTGVCAPLRLAQSWKLGCGVRNHRLMMVEKWSDFKKFLAIIKRDDHKRKSVMITKKIRDHHKSAVQI